MNREDETLAAFTGVAEHDVMALLQRYVNEQRWQGQGAYYAWGRMDGGDAPVVSAVQDVPNGADTARAFADLYVQMMSDYHERRRVSAIGLPSAWENFRVSGGASIEYPRSDQPVHVPA